MAKKIKVVKGLHEELTEINDQISEQKHHHSIYHGKDFFTDCSECTPFMIKINEKLKQLIKNTEQGTYNRK